MTNKIDKNKLEYVIYGSPALRKAICGKDKLGSLYFAIYYFTEYFTFSIPDYQFEMYSDIRNLTDGKLDEAMWCIFRDGAKTSIAKIAVVIWWICFKKKQYINWDSADGDNAESALFDITVALQTNQKLIADFGHLYFKKPTKEALSEAKMKRIKNFVTENGVRVAAFSTQESTRGRLFSNIRPDAFVIDDFENNKTKESIPITNKIIAHIDELRSGLSAGSSVLYLCNYITDSGSVAYIMEKLKNNPRAVVRFKPVIDKKGVLAWPARFTVTDLQAVLYNKNIPNPKLHKMSIESKRASLGEAVFETELMLNPSKSGDLFFNRDKVEADILKAREPESTNAGLKIWFKYNPKHRYGIGADTAEGLGGDSNASVIMDYSTFPKQIVATFEDPTMSNTTFGWELKRQGSFYNYPFIVPEINNTGYGTVAELVNSEYPLIYQREVKNKVTQKIQKEFGWRATVGTKFEVMGRFKEAYESGEIEIFDLGLLTEMKYITKASVRLISREKGATRHYDKLRAAALAYEGEKWAPLPQEEKKKAFSVPGQGINDKYRP